MAHDGAAAIAQALGHNSGRGLCHVHPQTAPPEEGWGCSWFGLGLGWASPVAAFRCRDLLWLLEALGWRGLLWSPLRRVARGSTLRSVK